MKRPVLLIFVFICIFSLLPVLFFYRERVKVVSPLGSIQKIREKPLEKYSFENLRKVDFAGSEITIGKLLKDGEGFSSYMFYYSVSGRKVSGLINLPKKEGAYPVIVMFRGYVEREKYTTGEGTRRSAEAIASNGFITLAPDFLGYGESDKPSNNSIEERFQTYTTALTLLSSVKKLNKALENNHCKDSASNIDKSEARSTKFETISNVQNSNSQNSFENLKIRISNLFRSSNLGFRIFPILQPVYATTEEKNDCIKNSITVDESKIGIWGHSNGGHIALSVLSITGKNYPTVLWNPVSKPFPYSILYFTDEFEDHGKALRKVVANFEKDYDVEKYSPANYYNWINAPIQLHQAADDESVPKRWSDQLNENLTGLKRDMIYFTYPGENHNFGNGSWGTAIQRSIDFYNSEFQELQKPQNP